MTSSFRLRLYNAFSETRRLKLSDGETALLYAASVKQSAVLQRSCFPIIHEAISSIEAVGINDIEKDDLSSGAQLYVRQLL